nr:UDP-N-acetylmuramoyl-L-alanine--D-glutamate ligase [Spirochaetota bacterium]
MNDKINKYLDSVKNKNILIQGLGLNGGGVGIAKFFLQYGIPLTITDLKSETELSPSIKELAKYKDKIKYVLGEHREEDFINADVVIKGPGVNPNTKFIRLAKENNAIITSDIAIFCEVSPCPLYAVTGSKGKSTTVSLIYNIFRSKTENSFIGGNITISPLTFVDKLNEKSLVILELSSWQLRDVKDFKVKFKISAITNLLNDHQNYYNNDMFAYLNDKAVITQNQDNSDFFMIPKNDKYINLENIKTNAKVFSFSKEDENSDFYLKNDSAFYKGVKLFDKDIVKLKGEHNELNALIAAGFCALAGIENEFIIKGISDFTGTPYRLELIREWNGIRFYNDTTATIPDAMV